MGNGSLLRVKCGRNVTLNPHPLLELWSSKGTAIPLLPLWAVRPVQSLIACTRVHFTFTLTNKELKIKNPINQITRHRHVLRLSRPAMFCRNVPTFWMRQTNFSKLLTTYPHITRGLNRQSFKIHYTCLKFPLF
jgi:hypothetical protein